jgi:hypothetical protein
MLPGMAYAGSIAVTPGAGTTVGAGSDGTAQIPAHIICGASASATLYATCVNQAIVNASGQFLVLATQSGTWNVGITGTATVSGTVAATQSGTWNITNVSGTVSLPTGASNSANQTNGSQKTQVVDASNANLFTSGNPGFITGSTIQPASSVPINISTATTTTLVPLSAGKLIYVSAWDVIANGTGNFTLEYGTGTNCAGGTTLLTGAYPLVAQFGISKGSGIGVIYPIPASNGLCAVTSAAVQYSGSVSYTQQ